MNALLKILLLEEKKITQLTLHYKELTKNKEQETNSERETRRHLHADILAIKKLNARIVKHVLNEQVLSFEEINKITAAHTTKVE